MSDALPSWLQVAIGLVGLVLPFLPVLRRRRKRTLRYSHWKIGGIERTRLDVIDDSQLWIPHACPPAGPPHSRPSAKRKILDASAMYDKGHYPILTERADG